MCWGRFCCVRVTHVVGWIQWLMPIIQLLEVEGLPFEAKLHKKFRDPVLTNKLGVLVHSQLCGRHRQRTA
jgi:hypothetical protein